MFCHYWQLCVVAGLLVSTVAGGCTSSQEGPRTKRIILMTNGADPFWDAMRAGMEQAEKDLNIGQYQLDAVMDVGDGTSKAQIDKLKNYANSTDVAAVAISSTDADSPALAQAMRDLQRQGIPIITVDSDMNRQKFRDARVAYIGTDNVIGGRQVGLAVRALKPEGGNYVSFVGLKSAANAKERHDGMAEAAGEEYRELQWFSDEMDLNVAQKNVRDAISLYGDDIDVFYGIWAYNAHAIAQELEKEPELAEEAAVVVFDAAPKAIRHMADGKIDAMVVQNPYQMGYEAVRLMTALVRDDHDTVKEMYPAFDPQTHKFEGENGDIMTTELRVVVPDSSSPITADIFDEGTVFYTFSEFKNWLDEKGLEGS